jgi:hypothetical protein
MLNSGFLTIGILLLLIQSAEAKCGNSSVTVIGRISGQTIGASVLVKISPDPNWEPQPDISIASDGAFKATVYFDRTSAERSTRDNCSREPDEVTVQLFKNGHVIDSVTLNRVSDFDKKQRHEYELRSPVILHSK